MNEWTWLSGLGDIGASALVTLFVLLVFFGRLVPKSQVDEIRADRDRWREALELSEKAREELSGAVRDASETGRTAIAILESIRRTAGS